MQNVSLSIHPPMCLLGIYWTACWVQCCVTHTCVPSSSHNTASPAILQSLWEEQRQHSQHDWALEPACSRGKGDCCSPCCLCHLLGLVVPGLLSLQLPAEILNVILELVQVSSLPLRMLAVSSRSGLCYARDFAGLLFRHWLWLASFPGTH